MARSINEITLLGNLGDDPKIITTDAGKKIANFSVATTESWKDKDSGEWVDRTEWHRIKTFNDAFITNVIEKKLKKGMQVLVRGEMRYRKFEDKDGQERTAAEVVIPNYSGFVEITGNKPKDDNQEAA